jgi:hypothetical protein
MKPFSGVGIKGANTRQRCTLIALLGLWCLASLYVACKEVVFASSIGDFAVRRGSSEVRGVVEQPAYLTAAVIGFSPFVCFTLGWRLWRMGYAVSGPRASVLLVIVCHGAVLIASVLLWLTLASSWSLVCNYRADEFRDLCDFAAEFILDAEPAAVPQQSIWLTNGGALATMRERDRQNNFFIANDHDFDLCILPERMDALLGHLRRSNTYWFAYYPEFRKIRVYPKWARLYRGHSGVFCLDVDVCDWLKMPTERVLGCNGHQWTRATEEDNIAHFAVEYPGSDWRVPSAENHLGTCQALPNW